MNEVTLERGRIKVNIKAFVIGNDLCVIISGGDSPHIGAVTLSIPRPGLADPSIISATTSVLSLTGHKDDEAARLVSQMLASNLKKNVVVTCGIHVDDISANEIGIVMDMLKESAEILIKEIIE